MTLIMLLINRSTINQKMKKEKTADSNGTNKKTALPNETVLNACIRINTSKINTPSSILPSAITFMGFEKFIAVNQVSRSLYSTYDQGLHEYNPGMTECCRSWVLH